MKNLVFLGPPGAGKGTQASRISESLSLPHISTGDILRASIRNQTEIGLKAKAYMDAGNLVPDEIVIGIVKERIAQSDCANGYILDGFPRTLAQAEALDTITTITMAVKIDVDGEKLVKRLSGRRVCPACGETTHVSNYDKPECPKCGVALIQRVDDNEDTIRNRLAVYNKSTQPLIDYYSGKGILKEIDGFQDIDKVTSDIVDAING
ncbi:MAG: adenylate kinase [Clostridia bacterium]|nr:adenylate kinase [Clostridia bacterium]